VRRGGYSREGPKRSDVLHSDVLHYDSTIGRARIAAQLQTRSRSRDATHGTISLARTMSTWREDEGSRWLALVVLATAVGAALRLGGLDAQSFWTDEHIWSVTAARPPTEIMRLPDGYPPLYGLLLHVLVSAGLDSDWWLRLPSAIAGILSIPVLYVIGRRTEDPVRATAAAGLLAIHPFAIWYSQEAGVYALLALCALVSTAFFLAMLDDGRRRAAVGYAASACLGFGLHYYFAFVVAAQACIAALDAWRAPGHRRMWLQAGLATLLAFAPWGQSFLADLASQSAEDSARVLSWLAMPYTALTFVGGLSLGPPIRTLHPALELGSSIWPGLQPYLPSTVFAITVCVLLGALGLARRLDSPRLLVLLLAVIPALGAWICSAVVVGYRPRYAFAGLPFAMIWFSGARRSRLPVFASILLVAFVALELTGLAQLDTMAYAREDSRAAARYIAARDPRATVVLLGDGAVPFDRYAKDVWRRVMVRPQDARDDAAVATLMAHTLPGAKDVWLVSSRPWTVDPDDRVASFLAERFPPGEAVVFSGVSVRHYGDRRAAER